MPGQPLRQALPLLEFKLDWVNRKRGPDEPELSISCAGMDSGLIVADFNINGSDVQVVVDTGASASFIAEHGELNSKNTKKSFNTTNRVKTADNNIVDLSTIVELVTRPTHLTEPAFTCQYYVMPNKSNLLGHQAIIGLDLIKLFNISVSKKNGLMTAEIDQQTIGKEKLLGPTTLGATKTLPAEKPAIPLSIQKLVESYKDIFADSATSTIKTDPITIPLAGTGLVKAKLRRQPLDDIKDMQVQIDALLKNQIIEPSTSPYSSNAHLVPKKNGQKRLVVNYIPLNAITVKDHYPLPQLPDLFSALHGAKYFAALDCTEGFFQIPILDEHKERTAFITPQGLFQFRKCPFGFTNSPAKFQRTMNEVFQEGLYTKCVIYIDDILVFGDNLTNFTNNLKWTFEKCRDFRVQLKPSKCKFCEPTVDFLGFRVAFNSIAPIPGKCDLIGERKPASKSEVLSVLGTLNYYARFIPNYAEKTKNLRKLTTKNMEFEWTEEHQKQLDDLKRDLDNALPLTIPNAQEPKYLEISLGQVSVESTCWSENGNLLARAGNVLTSSQLNYTPVEKTLLGLIQAYSKFGPILRGPVVIRTTCAGLDGALKCKERSERVNRLILQLPPDISFQVEHLKAPARIAEAKRSDDPPDEVFYTDGACTGNGKPHCKASWAVMATINNNLSCSGMVDTQRPSNQVAEITAVLKALEIAKREGLKKIIIVTDSKYVVESMNKWLDVWQENGWKDNRGKQVTNKLTLQELIEARKGIIVECLHTKGHSCDAANIEVDQMARDRLEQHLHTCASLVLRPSMDQDEDREIQGILSELERNSELRDRYKIIGDKLHYIDPRQPITTRYRLFVPETSRKLLIRIAHDDPIYGGHFGVKKTKAKLVKFYWPKMNTDIENYIKSCDECQQNKNPKTAQYGLLQPIPVSKIFERLHLDIVGPLKPSGEGHKYIITAIDAMSRYGYARACPEVKTSDILNFLEQDIISKHGIPSKIVTDNGCQFTSAAFKNFTDKLSIKHSRTTDYHPQANGMDERFNGTLIKIMKNYVEFNQKDWNTKLIWALMLYNNTINESTRASPYSILYGVEQRSPFNVDVTEEIGAEYSDRPQHELIRNTANMNTEIAQETQKKYYDKRRQEQNFKLLDLVMVRCKRGRDGVSKKLSALWEGPCMVTKIIQHNERPQAVEVLDMNRGKARRLPFQLLKHYHDRGDQPEEEEPNSAEPTLPGNIVQTALGISSPNELHGNGELTPSGLNQVNPAMRDDPDQVTTARAAHQAPAPIVRPQNLARTRLDENADTASFSTISITHIDDLERLSSVADTAQGDDSYRLNSTQVPMDTTPMPPPRGEQEGSHTATSDAPELQTLPTYERESLQADLEPQNRSPEGLTNTARSEAIPQGETRLITVAEPMELPSQSERSNNEPKGNEQTPDLLGETRLITVAEPARTSSSIDNLTARGQQRDTLPRPAHNINTTARPQRTRKAPARFSPLVPTIRKRVTGRR